MSTDLLMWLPAINPYWALRLSELQRSGRVRFHCLFNEHRDPGRSWVVGPSDMPFSHEVLPRGAVQRSRHVVRRYRDLDPRKVLTFHYDPVYWPVLYHSLARHRDFAFYVEKTWDEWSNRTPAKEFAKRALFTAAPTVLTPGADADAYVRLYRSARRPVQRLQHVVPLDRLRPARHDVSADPKVRFLCLGRLIPLKGLQVLMDAFDGVERPERMMLRIVGDGPMLPEVRAWAARSRVEVCLTDFVQSDRIAEEVLSTADVLVFPTRGDTYGLVVDEALGAGVPVISSDRVGEIAERLVADSRSPRGWVFESGSVAQLRRCIEEATDDRERRSRMGADAARFADTHLGLEHWVEQISRWVAA